MKVEQVVVGKQDRLIAFIDEETLFIALADGAGGIGGGEQAAAKFTFLANELYCTSCNLTASSISEFFFEVDHVIKKCPESGESTGLIAIVSKLGIIGASVGDSQLWLLRGGSITKATIQQFRKPLLGSGLATPVPFFFEANWSCLMAGSDGIFNYLDEDNLMQIMGNEKLKDKLLSIVDHLKLPSGSYQDDFSLLLCS